MFSVHTDQYILLITSIKSLKELYYKKQSIHWQEIISLEKMKKMYMHTRKEKKFPKPYLSLLNKVPWTPRVPKCSSTWMLESPSAQVPESQSARVPKCPSNVQVSQVPNGPSALSTQVLKCSWSARVSQVLKCFECRSSDVPFEWLKCSSARVPWVSWVPKWFSQSVSWSVS